MEVVLWINISLFLFSCISNWKCGFANRHIAIALLDHPWFHPLLARSAVMSLAAAIRCMFICTCTISIKARVWCHSTNHRGIWGNIGRFGKRLYFGNMCVSKYRRVVDSINHAIIAHSCLPQKVTTGAVERVNTPSFGSRLNPIQPGRKIMPTLYGCPH